MTLDKQHKNIAFIISKSEVGGAQTWVKDQIELFNNDVKTYLITNQEGWLTHNSKVFDTLIIDGLDSGFNIVKALKIASYLKKNRIYTIIASSANAGVYARLIKVLINIRVIYVSHGWSCLYQQRYLSKLYIQAERILSKITDKILCVSENDRVNAIEKIRISPEKLEVIRNGVFKRNIKTDHKQSNVLRILFLGRLSPPKRPDILIEAVRDLNYIHLDIVGSGTLKLSNFCSNNISFLGEEEGFTRFLDYDLFALISDSEGLPMSALEAASSGLPLLLSDVGGCGELIKKNGILVDNTVENTRHAISLMYKNYTYYKKNALLNLEHYQLEHKKYEYQKLYFNT